MVGNFLAKFSFLETLNRENQKSKQVWWKLNILICKALLNDKAFWWEGTGHKSCVTVVLSALFHSIFYIRTGYTYVQVGWFFLVRNSTYSIHAYSVFRYFCWSNIILTYSFVVKRRGDLLYGCHYRIFTHLHTVYTTTPLSS